jgi:ABC-type multidrug transport system fused ATPase/permease subunit
MTNFLLSFIPEWVFFLCLALGVLGVLASFVLTIIPFVQNFKLLIQVFSIFLLVVGVWFQGAIANENIWQSRISELELKLAKAESKSLEINLELTEEILKNEILREEAENAKEKIIIKYVTKYDNKCVLSDAFVRLLDSSANNEISPSPESLDGGTTDVKASEVLTSVTENYSTCYAIREKLIAWQEWYKKQKELHDTNNGHPIIN